MATPTSLITEIRYILGESTASFWQPVELSTWLVDVIRGLHVDLTPDAIKEILSVTEHPTISEALIIGGTRSTVLLDDNYFMTLLVQIKENDDEYGYPLTNVSREVFEEVKRKEGDADRDGTDTRIYTIDDTGSNLLVYPEYPVGSYSNLKHTWIGRLTESGTLNAPFYVLEAIKYKVVSIAFSKKGRDLAMSDRYEVKYERVIAKINFIFENKFGMAAAHSGRIRSTY